MTFNEIMGVIAGLMLLVMLGYFAWFSFQDWSNPKNDKHFK